MLCLPHLASLRACEKAHPGEFTRRSFENGRIDLTEAEGLADLIGAETETQRKAALALAEGGLRRQIDYLAGNAFSTCPRAPNALSTMTKRISVVSA